MEGTVIQAEGLGKRYRLGHSSNADTLRDALTGWMRRVGRRGHAVPPREELFWALRDVSFELQAGEVMGVIGRNGAGKSTLLKILSKITDPTEGRVRLRGRVASLLEVGTGFHPELTGRDNIYLNGAILGMRRTEIRRKFDEIVAFAGVERFLDTSVKHYSSGMYVRLAFAVAAHLEPEILIVDEVLAVGDAAFQAKCLGKMQEIASGSGRTVIFVSHQMAAVAQLTRRALLLQAGRVAFAGPTQEAIDRYLETAADGSATVFETEHLRRHNPSDDRARIIRLRFEKPSPQFDHGEPFAFAITVRAGVALDRLRTSITIYAHTGTPVGGAFSSDRHAVPAGASRQFRIELADHRLAPGHYFCDVGIGRGDPRSGHDDYDSVAHVLQFEVLPPAGIHGTVSTWNPGWGPIMYPALAIDPIDPP